MQAVIAEISRTKQAWDRWSYNHRLSHQAIIQAAAAKGIVLTEYIVEPIDWSHPEIFLQNNQQSHLEMTAAVGLQSSDLQDVDLHDDNQLVAWTWLHFLDHRNVETALGISS